MHIQNVWKIVVIGPWALSSWDAKNEGLGKAGVAVSAQGPQGQPKNELRSWKTMPCLMISLICRVPLIAFWCWKCWFWSDLDLKTTLLAQPGHLYKPSLLRKNCDWPIVWRTSKRLLLRSRSLKSWFCKNFEQSPKPPSWGSRMCYVYPPSVSVWRASARQTDTEGGYI